MLFYSQSYIVSWREREREREREKLNYIAFVKYMNYYICSMAFVRYTKIYVFREQCQHCFRLKPFQLTYSFSCSRISCDCQFEARSLQTKPLLSLIGLIKWAWSASWDGVCFCFFPVGKKGSKLVVEAEVDAPTVRSDGTLPGEGETRAFVVQASFECSFHGHRDFLFLPRRSARVFGSSVTLSFHRRKTSMPFLSRSLRNNTSCDRRTLPCRIICLIYAWCYTDFEHKRFFLRLLFNLYLLITIRELILINI